MAKLITWDAPIEDGVYIGLTDAEYFGQEALGSTDLIALHFRKWGWWWGSKYNPDRVEKVSKDRQFGKALHAILLEGIGAYEARFYAKPDPKDFEGLLTLKDEMKDRLRKEGFDLAKTSTFKLEQWEGLMRHYLPDVPVWGNIAADAAEAAGDREGLTALEDRMLRYMHEVALSDARDDNQQIRTMFADPHHPPLAEIAVFWTENGVRRRAKIDRMFPAFDLDLKSLGNYTGRPLPWVVGELIAKYGMDIQRDDYLDARTAAYTMLADGKLFGGTLEQRKWLRSWPESFAEWDWVWMFYQKPDPGGRAPIIFPVMDVTREWDDLNTRWIYSECVISGAIKKQAALRFYRENVARYGLGTPWARVEDLHFTDENRAPRIFLPHWISAVEPTEAGAYDDSKGEDDDG